MADVRIVYVHEDAPLADKLADAFEDAGFSVDSEPADAPLDQVGAGLLFWTQSAIRTPAFRSAAQATIDSGKAVIANLSGAPIPPIVKSSPVFDLNGWDGSPDDPRLDELSGAVESLSGAAPAPQPDTRHSASNHPAPETAPVHTEEEAYIAPEPETLSAANDDERSRIRVVMPRSRGRGAMMSVLALVALAGAAFGAVTVLRGTTNTNAPLPAPSARVKLTDAPTRAPNVVAPMPLATDTLPQSLPTSLPTAPEPTPAEGVAPPPAPATSTTRAPVIPPTTPAASQTHAPITYVSPPASTHATPAHRTPAHRAARRPRTRSTTTTRHTPDDVHTPPPVTSWDRNAPISKSGAGPPT